MASPFEILNSAVKAVPAVRYALGVAGLVAVIVIVRGFHIGFGIAALGAIVLLVLMTALVIFARLSSVASTHFRLPALIFTWFCLLLTMASAGMLFSHVCFGVPRNLSLWQGGEKESLDSNVNEARTQASTLEIESPATVTFGFVASNKAKPVMGIKNERTLARRDEKPTISRNELQQSDLSKIFQDTESIPFKKRHVVILEVLKGGPADAAGIRPGDSVEWIGTRPIFNTSDCVT